jgi:hypothetical protein
VEIWGLPWRWSLHNGKQGNEVDGFTIFVGKHAFTLENLILNRDKLSMDRFHKGLERHLIFVFPRPKFDVVVPSVVIVNQKPNLDREGMRLPRDHFIFGDHIG